MKRQLTAWVIGAALVLLVFTGLSAAYAQQPMLLYSCSDGSTPPGPSCAPVISMPSTSVPVVPAASHSSGQCVGPTTSIAVSVVTGQSGLVLNTWVSSASGVTSTLNVYLFHTQPVASTCADAGTFALAAADHAKLISPPFSVTLAAPNSVGTPTFGEWNFIPPHAFITGGDVNSTVRTIWYQLVATGTFTPAANGLTVGVGTALQ